MAWRLLPLPEIITASLSFLVFDFTLPSSHALQTPHFLSNTFQKQNSKDVSVDGSFFSLQRPVF
jgi:hypothetical protein